jgi:glucose 1-dehydrogenase/3-oxoacyl-[acyl-carrier protein] reductase
MKKTKSLRGKKVLVTGAGTGIGREVALELAREGAAVALHYSPSDTGAQSAVRAIRRAGGRAQAFGADFREPEAVAQLGRAALQFLGGLDLLVNNAGITMSNAFADVTPAEFDLLYAVNVRAPFFLTQAMLAPLRRRRGGIINLSSIHAFRGLPQHAVYAGTKGAIVAYTRELAIELAPQGIRVNAIAPGLVVVENYYKTMPRYDAKAHGRLIPAGFVGAPRDVARAVVFLASPDARYIVGQTLVIDGGTTAWMPFSDGFRQPPPFGRGRSS